MYSLEPLLITLMIKGRSINAYFAIFYFYLIGQEILPDLRDAKWFCVLALKRLSCI